MRKIVSWIKYAARVFLWSLRCIWRRYPKPRKVDGPYNKRYMKRIYRSSLQSIDREVSKANRAGMDKAFLLLCRRVIVNQRRNYSIPE